MNTTPEQCLTLYKIAASMAEAGLPSAFITDVVRVASKSQGCYELVELWNEAENDGDRAATVADLQELIDEAAELTNEIVKKPKINFDDLDKIINKILEHKGRLAQLIDLAGGQSEVSRKTGIPQPSLSRMLNSASMPRRRTLFKIASALDLSEMNIITEWVR